MNLIKISPSLKLALVLSSGILTGTVYSFEPRILLILISALLIFGLIWFRFDSDSILSLYISITIIFLFGIFKANIDFNYLPENSVKYIPETSRNSEVIIIGVITQIPVFEEDKIRITIESKFLLSAKDTFSVCGIVLCEIRKNIFTKDTSEILRLNPGDEVSINGKLADPAGKKNPGEFDYRKYLFLRGIHKIFHTNGFNKITILSSYNLSFLYQQIIFPLKVYFINIIDSHYSKDEAAYLKSLITGDRSSISDDIKEDFVNTGLMHLIAVSGLNVAYIILFIMLFLSLLRLRLNYKIFITIIFLIIYCLFTGSSASIVRASIMGIIVLVSVLMERKIVFYNSIGFAAAAILIYDSRQIFDPGFILSFAATISMVALYTRFENIFSEIQSGNSIFSSKFAKIIFVLFFTSLAAQTGTIPITANYFGKISFISLIANVIAVPMANLSLAIGFLQVLTSMFSNYFSIIISETNGLLLSLQLGFIDWCASFEFAFINVTEFTTADIVFFYTFIILIFSVSNLRKICFVIILSVILFSGYMIYNFNVSSRLRITFIDVGQGDCALIETPDEKTILVDCGKTSFITDSGIRTILPLLKRNGINKIDLMILTHLHLDHIGGVNSILENIEVGKIIESGNTYKSEFIRKMDSIIISKKIEREIINSGEYINDFENLRIYFLNPDNTNSAYNFNEDNLNNSSVAFILKYGDTDFFFTGDIEKESEDYMTKVYSDFLKTDVLKVAHHGSHTSTGISFILKNKPDFAVISCGKFNKFNHPSDIILNRIEKSNAKVFRTDTEGAVVMESDGNKVSIIDWK